MFSDFHLHNWSYGATYEGPWNSRLLDQRKVGEQILNLAELHRVDAVVFCGDLFHTHGRVEAGPLKVASELFRALRDGYRKVYALVGNHDLGRETNSVDWMKGLGIKIVDEAMVDTELEIGMAAYTDNKEVLNTRLKFLKEHPLKYWFLHQGVTNVMVGTDFVIPNEIFGEEDLPIDGLFISAFTGHYHSHRRVTEKLMIIGSPMQFNWSDKGELRGCHILDTWNDDCKMYPLHAPHFIELDEVLNLTRHHTSIGPDQFESVQDAFVRIKGNVPLAFMEDIRKLLIGGGARSVEFVVKKELPTTGIFEESAFDLGTLIIKYIKVNEVDKAGENALHLIMEDPKCS